jgi:hypothetical protein
MTKRHRDETVIIRRCVPYLHKCPSSTVMNRNGERRTRGSLECVASTSPPPHSPLPGHACFRILFGLSYVRTMATAFHFLISNRGGNPSADLGGAGATLAPAPWRKRKKTEQKEKGSA